MRSRKRTSARSYLPVEVPKLREEHGVECLGQIHNRVQRILVDDLWTVVIVVRMRPIAIEGVHHGLGFDAARKPGAARTSSSLLLMRVSFPDRCFDSNPLFCVTIASGSLFARRRRVFRTPRYDSDGPLPRWRSDRFALIECARRLQRDQVRLSPLAVSLKSGRFLFILTPLACWLWEGRPKLGRSVSRRRRARRGVSVKPAPSDHDAVSRTRRPSFDLG